MLNLQMSTEADRKLSVQFAMLTLLYGECHDLCSGCLVQHMLFETTQRITQSL